MFVRVATAIGIYVSFGIICHPIKATSLGIILWIDQFNMLEYVIDNMFLCLCNLSSWGETITIKSLYFH
jgi:hypothetical protein